MGKQFFSWWAGNTLKPLIVNYMYGLNLMFDRFTLIGRV